MKHIDGDTPVIATEADIILKKVIAQARKAGIPVSDNIDKNIVINKRAKTRLGACRMKKNGRKKHFTIEIGSALLVCDHEEIAEVIAHEVLHTCKGCMNHGNKWKEYAHVMNSLYGYNIKRGYTAENKTLKMELDKRYRYLIKCDSCGAEFKRQRKTKLIKNIENYRCRCGGKLHVTEIERNG